VNAECDCVGQTLIREQTTTKTVTIGKKPSHITTKTGKKEYCLRVGPHETYYAGFRLANGRTVEQDFIVDPTYAKIKALVDGTDEDGEG
jgi:hypothetical protein